MTLTGRTLTEWNEIDRMGDSWDALALSRGVHTDLYDTYTWTRAYLETLGTRDRDALRIVSVFDGEELVAALPLTARSETRWETLGFGSRPRIRPIFRGESPREGILESLVEEIAANGVRELSLRWLPERDPATPALIEAFRTAGYETMVRQGGTECLAETAPTWDEHRKAFKKYDRTVKNFANKARRLGDLTMECFAPSERSSLEGYEEYVALHASGWKGEVSEKMNEHRRRLLEACDEKGWSRLFLLRVADVPTAAIVWFRLGDVAVAYSTVYQQQMAALSAGTVVMWWAHEKIFAEDRPALIDYLPGRGSQKDQLGPIKDPVLVFDAVKKSLVSGWTAPLKAKARSAAGRISRMVGSKKEEGGFPSRDPVAVCRITIDASDPSDDAHCEALELCPKSELFLTVCGGFASPKRMKDQWEEGDSWWLYSRGGRVVAVLRVGEVIERESVLREVVLVDATESSLERVLAVTAHAVGASIRAEVEPSFIAGGESGEGRPVPVHRALLPWPLPVS